MHRRKESHVNIQELTLPASLRGRRGLEEAIRAELERRLSATEASHNIADVRVPADGMHGATPVHRIAERVGRAVHSSLSGGGK